MQTGSYVDLDLGAQSRLWLTRFTSPGLLANYDVSFVYDAAAFCALATRPPPDVFHTSRFAVARKDGDRFKVEDALQVQKIDLCSTDAAATKPYAIISKEHFKGDAPRFSINWAVGGAVRGLDSLQPSSNDLAPDSMNVASWHARSRPDASRQLSKSTLELYAAMLKDEGVKLNYTSAAWSAAPSKYCVRDLRTSNPGECFASMSKAAESLGGRLRAARGASATKEGDVLRNKRAIYELSIVAKD